MQVTRIYESPRVTKPYTDEQWAESRPGRPGRRANWCAGDVRLTMGGEPTFVAVDDRDGAEWNTDALGPTKRGFATELVHKLRDEYGQGGFLHFGQGKWYPGEQLPRWALNICWRTDGQPMLARPGLFADERDPPTTPARTPALHPALARALGLTDRLIVQPGLRGHLVLPVARAPPAGQRRPVRLAAGRRDGARPPAPRVHQGLDTTGRLRAAAQARMATARPGRPALETGPWFLRDERMYLMPGRFADGLPPAAGFAALGQQGDYPYLIEQDPFAPRRRCPPRRRCQQHGAAGRRRRWPTASPRRRRLAEGGGVASGRAMARRRPAPAAQAKGCRRAQPSHGPPRHARPPRANRPGITRTALCVEVRDPRAPTAPRPRPGRRSGVLYVFMPPLAHLEDYLELLAAIEATAAGAAA
jgi:uncharacterized protein (DUF2126 family)